MTFTIPTITTNFQKKMGKNPFYWCMRRKTCDWQIPFLKRDIKDTQYADLTSVYGYAGPIAEKFGPELFQQGTSGTPLIHG